MAEEGVDGGERFPHPAAPQCAWRVGSSAIAPRIPLRLASSRLAGRCGELVVGGYGAALHSALPLPTPTLPPPPLRSASARWGLTAGHLAAYRPCPAGSCGIVAPALGLAPKPQREPATPCTTTTHTVFTTSPRVDMGWKVGRGRMVETVVALRGVPQHAMTIHALAPSPWSLRGSRWCG